MGGVQTELVGLGSGWASSPTAAAEGGAPGAGGPAAPWLCRLPPGLTSSRPSLGGRSSVRCRQCWCPILTVVLVGFLLFDVSW